MVFRFDNQAGAQSEAYQLQSLKRQEKREIKNNE